MNTNSNILIYQTQGISVYWNPTQQYIHVDWEGAINSNSYRTALEEALHFANRNKIQKWYSDRTDMTLMSDDDTYWTNTYWNRLWTASSIKEVVVVEPKEKYGKMAFKNLINRQIIKRMNMKFYPNRDIAKEYTFN